MNYLFETEDENVQVSLSDLHAEKPILLVLLRHTG
ncbi:hypothetical protein J2S74_000140 [Evansella vedderi]|uniref:Uncharacterized protein n=1 Tax=Evansella vedderi TaxID=38282 RepID=A0ABT9ZNG2_9BACI|nr:hypothetical protein [Evansella vedderi]